MKKTFVVLLSFLFIIHGQSQNNTAFFKTLPVLTENTPEWARLMYSSNPNVAEVEDLFKAYYKTHELTKTIHTQNHKHWILMVEPLLDQNGFIVQADKTQEDNKYLQLKEKYQQRNSKEIPDQSLDG